MNIINLQCDDWHVSLAPTLGGAIIRCDYKGQGILRRSHADQISSPLDTACFPLVPFSNRIANGQFSFDGQDVKLPPNMANEAHAIHGSGWQNPWQVTGQTVNNCEMVYDHKAGDWPWSFTSKQTISVQENRITLKLSLHNTDKKPMPAGLGLHPYFPNLSKAKLQFKSEGVWKCGENCLPTDRIETPPHWNFDARKPLQGLGIDNCFTGWDGAAEIIWADKPYRVTIQSTDQTPYAILYTNPKDDYFCFEPASHMNNGVNWGESNHATGVKILRAGETMKIEMHLIAAQKARRFVSAVKKC